ncbi:hypothetical protein [Pseudomonas sp. Root569]|uniref:hypothetical protein n=1 Tax=Pseudomonas sp. Root569 TaxID=1736566 RepID=UPI0012E33FEA|nr:hypothetical protein [Pseudomonas sp. Root569]
MRLKISRGSIGAGRWDCDLSLLKSTILVYLTVAVELELPMFVRLDIIIND